MHQIRQLAASPASTARVCEGVECQGGRLTAIVAILVRLFRSISQSCTTNARRSTPTDRRVQVTLPADFDLVPILTCTLARTLACTLTCTLTCTQYCASATTNKPAAQQAIRHTAQSAFRRPLLAIKSTEIKNTHYQHCAPPCCIDFPRYLLLLLQSIAWYLVPYCYSQQLVRYSGTH